MALAVGNTHKGIIVGFWKVLKCISIYFHVFHEWSERLRGNKGDSRILLTDGQFHNFFGPCYKELCTERVFQISPLCVRRLEKGEPHKAQHIVPEAGRFHKTKANFRGSFALARRQQKNTF